MVQQKLVSSEKTNEKEKICRDELSSKLNHNEWKEYQLKEIATINPKTGEIPKKFCYIDLESVQSGLLMSKKIIHSDEAPSRAQRVLKPNDILYQTVRPYQKNNLFFEFTDMDYVASTGYAQIRTNKLCTPEFLYYLLHTEKFVNNVLARCTGTSYPAINSNDLKKIKVKVPEIPIQMKIENIIISIDKKIELLEKKLVLYQKFNESMKEELFTNFEPYTKLRLNKFLKESKIKSKDNINRRLTVKLNLKGITKREVKSVEKEGATTQYLRKEGQFIYGKQNLHKGAFGIIPKELDNYLSSSDIPSFDFIEDTVNPMWFYFYFSRKSFYIKLERFSIGTGSKRISPDEFLNIQISIPELTIQNKQAEFLNNLNKKENVLKNEISSMKIYKKYLLQKMFV